MSCEFAYDGGGLGKGGLVTLLVNGEKVAEGRIDRTQPMIFSADEGADVGEDGETPVVGGLRDTQPLTSSPARSIEGHHRPEGSEAGRQGRG